MSYNQKYLKYKQKYLDLKYNNLKGGYIPDSIIGKEMILSASQILKYNIHCTHNIPNGVYNSLDSRYSNYSFQLRSCQKDHHGYFYLTIFKKYTHQNILLPIINNNIILIYIKYISNIFSVYINSYDYVYNLKNVIFKKIGMTPIQQQLIFNYINLEDNNVIASYNICNNDTIMLFNKQSLYPTITTGLFPNEPISIFNKFPKKKKSYSSSDSSSSSSSDLKYRSKKSIKSDYSDNENKNSNDSESDIQNKNNDNSTSEIEKINYNLWFILNEKKDSFNYWQEYNNDKIEKIYQDYLDTIKSVKYSALTTIEPKILADFKKMNLITVNIDNSNTTRKIKRVFLEKLKISSINWLYEDDKKWNKLENLDKIEEIYQIYTLYKTFFIKNPIFYLSEDTFLDLKNMIIIIKDKKKNIKREQA
jgi:hypothetical protein